jgi:hypothetical protein
MEFVIPKQAQVVIVNDFFVSDLQGGAELTTEALISYSPYQCFKLHSQSVTEELVRSNKDKYWILCNYSQVNKNALIEFVQSNVRYSIVEYDYKYCKYRSSHLHEIQEKKSCDCHLQENGRFVKGFMKRAKSVHFMSYEQMNEYKRLFPDMGLWGNTSVQSSTWTVQHLDKLKELNKNRGYHLNRWAILGGGSWIKNQQATEEYCKSKGIQYDVIGNLPYEQFIEKLSTYSCLCFHPMGFDTCPRLVVEAKLLGLDLELNNNVQHKDEAWFKGKSAEEVDSWLRTRGKHFWNLVGFHIAQ